MRSSKAQTVEQYLAQLPPDRRQPIGELRQLILQHLPAGYEEGIQFGMLGYYIPLSRYPSTYNKQPLSVAALASQKQYMSLYLMTVYGHPEKERWFAEAFREAGKKLDMGKSCVRFKSLADLELPAIAQVIGATSVDEYIAHYEASRSAAPRSAKKPAPPAKKKPTPRKTKKKPAPLAKKAPPTKKRPTKKARAPKKRGARL